MAQYIPSYKIKECEGVRIHVINGYPLFEQQVEDPYYIGFVAALRAGHPVYDANHVAECDKCQWSTRLAHKTHAHDAHAVAVEHAQEVGAPALPLGYAPVGLRTYQSRLPKPAGGGSKQTRFQTPGSAITALTTATPPPQKPRPIPFSEREPATEQLADQTEELTDQNEQLPAQAEQQQQQQQQVTDQTEQLLAQTTQQLPDQTEQLQTTLQLAYQTEQLSAQSTQQLTHQIEQTPAQASQQLTHQTEQFPAQTEQQQQAQQPAYQAEQQKTPQQKKQFWDRAEQTQKPIQRKRKLTRFLLPDGVSFALPTNSPPPQKPRPVRRSPKRLYSQQRLDEEPAGQAGQQQQASPRSPGQNRAASFAYILGDHHEQPQDAAHIAVQDRAADFTYLLRDDPEQLPKVARTSERNQSPRFTPSEPPQEAAHTGPQSWSPYTRLLPGAFPATPEASPAPYHQPATIGDDLVLVPPPRLIHSIPPPTITANTPLPLHRQIRSNLYQGAVTGINLLASRILRGRNESPDAVEAQLDQPQEQQGQSQEQRGQLQAQHAQLHEPRDRAFKRRRGASYEPQSPSLLRSAHIAQQGNNYHEVDHVDGNASDSSDDWTTRYRSSNGVVTKPSSADQPDTNGTEPLTVAKDGHDSNSSDDCTTISPLPNAVVSSEPPGADPSPPPSNEGNNDNNGIVSSELSGTALSPPLSSKDRNNHSTGVVSKEPSDAPQSPLALVGDESDNKGGVTSDTSDADTSSLSDSQLSFDHMHLNPDDEVVAAVMADINVKYARASPNQGESDSESEFTPIGFSVQPHATQDTSPQHPTASSPQRSVASSPQRPVAFSPQHPVASSPKRPVASSPKRPVASSPRRHPTTSSPKRPVASSPRRHPTTSSPSKHGSAEESAGLTLRPKRVAHATRTTYWRQELNDELKTEVECDEQIAREMDRAARRNKEPWIAQFIREKAEAEAAAARAKSNPDSRPTSSSAEESTAGDDEEPRQPSPQKSEEVGKFLEDFFKNDHERCIKVPGFRCYDHHQPDADDGRQVAIIENWFKDDAEYGLPGLGDLRRDANPNKVDEVEKDYLIRSRVGDAALQSDIQRQVEEEEERRRKEAERLRREAEERRRAEEAALARVRQAEQQAEQKRINDLQTRLGLRQPRGKFITPLGEEWEDRVSTQTGPGCPAVRTCGPESLNFESRDFARLLPPTSWLNDSCIQTGLQQAAEWINKDAGVVLKQHTPKCVALNSFFWSQLIGPKGVAGKERMLKRLWGLTPQNFLDVDSIILPVNSQAHWTFFMVRPKRREFLYVDSFQSDRPPSANRQDGRKVLRKFLEAFLGGAYKEEEWKQETVKVPLQTNSWDCGVFVITNAILLALGIDPSGYSQNDLPLQRRRIAASILNGGFKGEFDLAGL